MGACKIKIRIVTTSRWQKTDVTIEFSTIELARKALEGASKRSFYSIFSMLKIEKWGLMQKMHRPTEWSKLKTFFSIHKFNSRP